MIISKAKLNEKYKQYCTNKKLDILNEASTKEFMEYYMKKNNLTHVKQNEDSFYFLKAGK